MGLAGSSYFGSFLNVVVVDAIAISVSDEIDADLSSLRIDVSIAADLVAICVAMCDGRLTRMRITIAGFTIAILRLILTSDFGTGWLGRWVDPCSRNCASQEKESCNLKCKFSYRIVF